MGMEMDYLSTHFIYRMSDTTNNTADLLGEPDLLSNPVNDSAGSQAGYNNDLANTAIAAQETGSSDNQTSAPPTLSAPPVPTIPAPQLNPESDESAQLLGNYYEGIDSSIGQVKITATKGNDPTIIRINTNGEDFIVNIPVAEPSAPQELANAIHYGKDYKTKPSIAATGKPGIFRRMLGKTAKGGSSGGRIGNTKKNRKHRITRSNRKKVRPSRRR